MAEPKKKPTLRKAPKGPLDGSGSAAKKAQRKAVKAALAKDESQEKAAAKEAIEHAKAASKERKVQKKADAKAAKEAEKQARAEEKARAKAEKAEKRAQKKASAGEPADAAVPDEKTEATDEAGAEAEEVSSFSARKPGDEEAGAEQADALSGELSPEVEDAVEEETPSREVRFVSGEDAYAARGTAPSARRPRVHLPWLRILRIAVVVLLVALVVLVAAFSWNRWLRYDDASDFQGVWSYGENSALTVTFDGTTMSLTKDASYDYELDTFSKTVAYRFGDLSGGGCYAFSEDRNTLVIVDGRAADIGSILGFQDIAENAPTHDDGTSAVIVLVRAGAVPSQEPSAPTTSTSEQAPPASSSATEEASPDSRPDVAADSSGEDGAEDYDVSDDSGSGDSAEDTGGGSEDIDSLGSDPGSEAGANVVTPEDLGIRLEESEES